jgi:hypothetical protein
VEGVHGAGGGGGCHTLGVLPNSSRRSVLPCFNSTFAENTRVLLAINSLHLLTASLRNSFKSFFENLLNLD